MKPQEIEIDGITGLLFHFDENFQMVDDVEKATIAKIVFDNGSHVFYSVNHTPRLAAAKEGFLHQIANGHVPHFQHAFVKAFAAAHRAMEVKPTADAAIKALVDSLKATLPALLRRAVGSGGRAAARRLVATRSAESLKQAILAKKFKFDAVDQRAVDWADRHSAELITNISETTREDINNAIAEALELGDIEAAFQDIVAAIGDTERARLIARHETMLAVSEGQRQAWDQAVDEGLLTGREKRTWITVGDGKVCPICENLDGARTNLDGVYPGDIEGPPAHVSCRCTEGLA